MQKKRKKDKVVRQFLLMSQKMPLHRINVKDLCSEAGVSRTTFYRNYDGIYDLAESLEEEHIKGFLEIAAKHETRQSSMEEYMRDILEYIRQEEDFFKSVLSEHADRHFIIQWKKIIYNDSLKQYRMDAKKISEIDRLNIEMLISGAIGAYSYWLFHMNRISVEHMIPMIMKMWDFYKM